MTEQWWQSAVVYQVYPRSFADGNGDGIGDLPGILSRLDHLQHLGVDALWLSPVYPSPMDDNGYDISDYQGVDPLFGSLEDLDALIAGLHERGMRLVMDLVVNHTSDEHPWFQASRSGREDPRRDWYWWRPAREGTVPGEPGAEPTNWGSFFSGPCWEYDEASGEYYLHLFSRKQPDLNWENPEVREAVYTMMRWWVERGVDGFRMDVINLISKDTALPDGPVRPGERYGDLGRFVVDGPRVHEFLQEMHREVFAGIDRPLLLVGETPGVSIEEARAYTDPAHPEVDMVFQFEHMGIDRGASKWDVLPFDMRVLRRCLAEWQDGLADVGWNSLYWDNHDQPRVVSRFGHDGEYRVQSAKMLGTILHMQRGTPYIYQGEEFGMTNMPFAGFDEFQDIEARNYYRDASEDPAFDAEALLESMSRQSRDNARTPVQWDSSEHAGFTTGTPWFRVNPNYPEVNAEAAVADEDSVFHHYRKLIALRHEHPVIVNGDFRMLLEDDPAIYAFTRALDGTTLLVLGNFSSHEVAVPLPDAADWASATLLVGNYPGSGNEADGLTLRPWETRVYLRD